jgi:predicted DCC family thiol-disulfide oxidoreductase YuxK
MAISVKMNKNYASTYQVVLFDGVCNFCNHSINFVIKRDRKNLLKFAALQSEAGLQLMEQYGLSATNLQSFIFIEKGKAFDKSTAALKVCKYLGAAWPLCYGFIIVPKVIRDGLYNFVAKNRYKWFGKQNECMVPTPAVRAKFLI